MALRCSQIVWQNEGTSTAVQYVETLVQHLTVLVGDFLIGIIHIFVRPSLPAVFGERHAQITAVGFAQGLNSFPNAR